MGHAWEQRDEAIVAGTVDEVWAAIATGPGIDSWYMGRTRVEPGSGGSVATDMGGFVMNSTVTAWQPPNHLAFEHSDGPGQRSIAFEYLVEGRDQGGAVVRVVTSGFLPDDDWETEFEAMSAGGQMYFRTLVAYLDHFAGRFATPVHVSGEPVADWPSAWTTLRTALGLGEHPVVGDKVAATVPGVGDLAGEVDFVNPQALIVRTGDGLFSFIQGFFGSFVLGHHVFADIDEKEAGQAWTSWLAAL